MERATLDDAVLLSDLLEPYMHDLSDVFSIDIGAEGRFGCSKLPHYWAEPERRLESMIREGFIIRQSWGVIRLDG